MSGTLNAQSGLAVAEILIAVIGAGYIIYNLESFKSAVSDWHPIDTIEAGASEAANAIGAGATEAANAISNWWDSTEQSVENWWDNVSNPPTSTPTPRPPVMTQTEQQYYTSPATYNPSPQELLSGAPRPTNPTPPPSNPYVQALGTDGSDVTITAPVQASIDSTTAQLQAAGLIPPAPQTVQSTGQIPPALQPSTTLPLPNTNPNNIPDRGATHMGY